MKNLGVLLLVLILVLCCVSCSANTTNTGNAENTERMTAGELKTHVIYGELSSYYENNTLEVRLNTWLTENSEVQIVDIQYAFASANPDGDTVSVLIIYQE